MAPGTLHAIELATSPARRMPRPKVTIDYRCALLGHGGIARATRELVKALAARGDVEVHLYAHSFARAAQSVRIPAHATLHRLPIPSRALRPLARLGIGPEHLAGNTRLFHFTDYVYPPLQKARGLVTLHDVAFAHDQGFHGERMSKVLLERTHAACAAATLVVVPTQASAADAERTLGIPRSKLRIVPFGADHVPECARDDRRCGRARFVMLGTIEPRKNHLRTLEAMRSLPERQRPELVVIGRVGWECDATVLALRAAQREGLVRWLESADDASVAAELRSADALLYPSLLEGFGFPPLEAMRMGIPVLAGDTAALREVLGDAALFCDPRSVPAIAASLAELARDRDLRKQLALRGREQSARWTWAACAIGYANAYREALA